MIARGFVLGLGLAVACGGDGPHAGEPAPAHERGAIAVEEHGAAREERPSLAGERGAATGDAERAAGGARGETASAATPTGKDRAQASASATTPTPPTEPEPRPEHLDFVFVGDVVLGEYVGGGHRSFAGPLAPGDPFADVAELLEADLVVGNLESPVMRQIPEQSPLRYGHRFGASAPAVEGLAAGGFDVMSVANNHANDLGREGLEQTPEVLRAAGITPVGEARYDGSPLRVVTTEHRGWRIGWISATTWLNHAPAPGDPKVPVVAVSQLKGTLVPLVEQARAEHDLVIVLLHWGRERRERPEPAQIHAAHAFIDAGATLVIGHHPHVLQGIERYGDGLIAYSLGNFLFPAREEAFRDSAVLRVRVGVAPRRAAEATAYPIRLAPAPSHAPRQPSSRQRRTVQDRLQGQGMGLSTSWIAREGALTLRPGTNNASGGRLTTAPEPDQSTTMPLASTAQNQ